MRDVGLWFATMTPDELAEMMEKEPGLRRDQMIAVMTSFCRDGRTVSADDAGYRFYCRLWCAVRPLRRVWKAAFRRVKRLLRRIVP